MLLALQEMFVHLLPGIPLELSRYRAHRADRWRIIPFTDRDH